MSVSKTNFPYLNKKLFAYLYQNHNLTIKKELSSKDLDINEVLIMAEGHCFKNKSLELCKIKKTLNAPKIHFEHNNVYTLINLIDTEIGITLLS